jgi:transcriptional antiterminator RfaH
MVAHDPKIAWFCLRSQPKHEHIAAARLRRLESVDVFLPRIRFRRLTKKGPVWVTEALFPNYLFARFDWKKSLRSVHHSPGVSGVVHFGVHWPTIADEVINDLRVTLGQDEVHIIPMEVSPGDRVKIAGGNFHGFHAIVTQVMPGQKRVALLLDFLGQQSTVKLDVEMVIKDADERESIL